MVFFSLNLKSSVVPILKAPIFKMPQITDNFTLINSYSTHDMITFIFKYNLLIFFFFFLLVPSSFPSFQTHVNHLAGSLPYFFLCSYMYTSVCLCKGMFDHCLFYRNGIIGTLSSIFSHSGLNLGSSSKSVRIVILLS